MQTKDDIFGLKPLFIDTFRPSAKADGNEAFAWRIVSQIKIISQMVIDIIAGGFSQRINMFIARQIDAFIAVGFNQRIKSMMILGALAKL